MTDKFLKSMKGNKYWMLRKYHGNKNNYTLEEKNKIVKAYENNGLKMSGWLDLLATDLKRNKANISRYARGLGLTNKSKKEAKLEFSCAECGGKYLKYKYIPKKTCSNKCARLSEAKTMKKWHKNNPHPRGMLGKHHSTAYGQILSMRMKKAWKDPNSIYNSEQNRERHSISQSKSMVARLKKDGNVNGYSRTTKGWRDFKNGKRYFMKSKWEMNYGLYLDWLCSQNQILDWDYEQETFWFEKIKRGVRSYTPDFRVFKLDGSVEYHEVKGWMDAKSKTKLSRMKLYFPHVEMLLIDEDQYKALKKQGRLFGWE